MAENSQSKEEVVASILKFLDKKIEDKDMAELRRILFDPGELRDVLDPQLANDAASGRGNPVRALQAFREAEAECSQYLNRTPGLAFDSAAAVYRHALVSMGVAASDAAQVKPHAARAVFRAMRQAQGGARLAADSAPNQAARDALAKRFPGAVIPRRA